MELPRKSSRIGCVSYPKYSNIQIYSLRIKVNRVKKNYGSKGMKFVHSRTKNVDRYTNQINN